MYSLPMSFGSIHDLRLHTPRSRCSKIDPFNPQIIYSFDAPNGPYGHLGGTPIFVYIPVHTLARRLNQQCWPQRLVQEQDSPLQKGHISSPRVTDDSSREGHLSNLWVWVALNIPKEGHQELPGNKRLSFKSFVCFILKKSNE